MLSFQTLVHNETGKCVQAFFSSALRVMVGNGNPRPHWVSVTTVGREEEQKSELSFFSFLLPESAK